MKKIILFMVCAAALILTLPQARAASTPPVSTQYQHINNSWFAPNSTYPDCSTTVTANCLDTYTLSLTSPSGNTIILTVPNGAIAAGGTVVDNWTPGGFLYCGNWPTSVVANFRDGAGLSVSSSADTATASVQCPLVPSPATNLVSTPAP